VQNIHDIEKLHVISALLVVHNVRFSVLVLIKTTYQIF